MNIGGLFSPLFVLFTNALIFYKNVDILFYFGIINAIKTKPLSVDTMIIRNIKSKETNLKGKSFYITNGKLLADLNLLDEIKSAFEKKTEELENFFEKTEVTGNNYQLYAWLDSNIQNIPFIINGQEVEIVRKIDVVDRFYIISVDTPIENEQYTAKPIFESNFPEILHWQIQSGYERDDNDDKFFTEKLCYEVNEKCIYSIADTFGQ